MRIILSGGGTIGSVSPLLGVFEEISKIKPECQFLWLSTRKGPEIKLISAYQLTIKRIFAGKNITISQDGKNQPTSIANNKKIISGGKTQSTSKLVRGATNDILPKL